MSLRTRKTLIFLTVYVIVFAAMFGVFWITERYEALHGLSIFLRAAGLVLTAYYLWRAIGWLIGLTGTVRWERGLPWQCVLRGHAISRYRDVQSLVPVALPDGDTGRPLRQAWVRQACQRCYRIHVNKIIDIREEGQ